MRSFEKEVLGYYVHSHPLAEFQEILSAVRTHGTADLVRAPAKSEVVIGGLVASIKLSNTKQPRQGSTHTRYAMFDLEDMDGLVRTICWPEDYARMGEAIEADAVVLVAGSIDRRAGSDETNLIVNAIVPIHEAWKLQPRHVTLRVNENEHDITTLDSLSAVAKRHPGAVPLRLVIRLSGGSRVLLDADGTKVDWSPSFLGDVGELLGEGSVRASVAVGGRRADSENGRSRRMAKRPAAVAN
jgi:DNA polymerase-3 subunit alpha